MRMTRIFTVVCALLVCAGATAPLAPNPNPWTLARATLSSSRRTKASAAKRAVGPGIPIAERLSS